MSTDAALLVFILFLWSVALTKSDVVFASLQDGQKLATRIQCEVEDEEHFRYQSESTLWGEMGGKILMEADVSLRCLGADLDGKYGSEALKYNIQISNLRMREGTQQRRQESSRRKKRGATRDFFSNSWKKVKNFFNRMLGRPTTQETKRTSSGDHPVSDDKPPSDDDEVFSEEEELLSSSLHYGVPFQLVQLGDGMIPEIRFSEEEVEESRVRNFKRHLADAFSTRLHITTPTAQQQGVVEKSVMGEHTSTYNISIGGERADYYSWADLMTSQNPPEKGAGGEKVVMVNKMTTTDDIVNFAPSDALNIRDGMDIKSNQIQIFRNGRMTASTGVSTLSLVSSPAKELRRKKRATDDYVTEDDAHSYIRTETTYNFQLRRRNRRSPGNSNPIQEENEHIFKAASRIAELEDIHHQKDKRRLSNLQESVDLNMILEDLTNGKEMNADDKMESLDEVIEEEIALNLDGEYNSLCNAIRTTLTLQRVEEMCTKNHSTCRDYLILIALAGGPSAEEIFLHLVGNSSKSATVQQLACDILSDILRPSPLLLNRLIEIVQKGGPRTNVGAISISLGSLASRTGPSDLKSRVSDLLSDMLKGNEDCDDPLIIDLLEAVGNLRCDQITTRILEVSRRCKEKSTVQIASIHALRYSPLLGSGVVEWLEQRLQMEECELRREVVGFLMDRIEDEMINTSDVQLWPLFHFNSVDKLLGHFLEEEDDCFLVDDILLYFSKKKNQVANDIARLHYQKKTRRKKRRALWNDLNCREWTEDNDNPIQGREEFASDRSTFNKRKSCLVSKKIGMKGANAEIYAGMFAGVKEPLSDPPKYKLFTKFASGFNFLGQKVDVGSFYFYLFSGGKTKAFVRIMGRTRQEFTNDGCTPTELRYRPLKHIPLYMVSIANVQLSLGIHLSSRLSVDTLCPEDDIYQLQPLTDVRIGGEAIGTVGFIRGAANVGANFNYKLQFTFSPVPNMCLKGNHGFDPMNINFESYFQLWNEVKQDWGKVRTWKPTFMSWEIKRGELKQWFDDTCIVPLNTSSSSSIGERELE